MKQDTDQSKRELLLNAAMQEFTEKGYNKASLRTICSRAGVTTGALYFFFENKADLFAAIVDPPITGLRKIIFDHFMEDSARVSEIHSIEDSDMDHKDISDKLVDHIYDNYESFILVLTASENTVYENIVDEFVKLTERSVPMMISAIPGYTYDGYMAHWMAHISIDAYIQVIKHERDREKARGMLGNIMNYLVKGWVELVMIKS
ncbi:MAG: TetR/AcrR family transcriptional regulator [Lachnospiraceae bacterium]|nr:TetR/AcrR family transcriptional regulator [Lachnospiraceae bacterium]